MADNFTAKNASGTTITFSAKDIGSGILATQPIVMAQYLAALPTLTDLDYTPIITDINGQTIVNLGTQLDPTNDGVRAHRVYDYVYAAANTAYQIKRSGPVNVNSGSPVEIVAAVTAKSILVLGFDITVIGSGAFTFNFQDDAGTPVVLSNRIPLDLSGVAGFAAYGWSARPEGTTILPTTAGQALMGLCSSGVDSDVSVLYIEI